MLRRFLVNYYERHQHPANQLLHLIGLPVTFVVPVILLVQGRYLFAAISFVVGYALQFAGHAIEGNDAGEVILVKKMLGKPYVSTIPRSIESSRDD
ncbi:DUF962 domain-containing protein [Maioricimonas sp. JC845]|uniref:DUF962 domain-containing protein n=1 Tax=Maioricimonas sp. JC845 TaxID=3232138 RepID=UPI003458F0BF